MRCGAAGATGDAETGPGENRYLFITADFDSAALPEPPQPANREFEDKEQSEWSDDDRENKKLADDYTKWEEGSAEGQETAEKRSERFAPWYYVISAESFDKIHLERSDLVRVKEETDEST